MRYAVRCSTCTLLTLCATTLLAQESETKSPWWHFGRDQEVAAPQAGVTPAPTLTPAPETIAPVDDDSWFKWPSMPEWRRPQFASESDAAVTDLPAGDGSTSTTPRSRFARSRFGKPEHHSRPRNTWAQRPASTATDSSDESTWESMKSSTRNAWHKTVDFVTPSESSDAAVVASEPKSTWWQRMWGTDGENPRPQTVTEWMAQDRIDP